jgi:hypothetical protein
MGARKRRSVCANQDLSCFGSGLSRRDNSWDFSKCRTECGCALYVHFEAKMSTDDGRSWLLKATGRIV